MSYPEAINLPFNMTPLSGRFHWVYPEDDRPDGSPCWLLLQGGALMVQRDGDGSLQLPSGDLPQGLALSSGDPVCFGSWDGRPLLAAQVSRESQLPATLSAEQFNANDDRLDDIQLTLGGLAQQVLWWLQESRRCSRCGTVTQPHIRNWGRCCPACQAERFPAVSPCAIVLVRRGAEFLLTRKAAWPQGRYSLVAGFLDPGESLEECAAREVLEETGIRIANLKYVGSQHWPFPSQLMAGFVADYAGGEIRVDERELEDARWFSRAQPPLALPGKRSIARWIIDRYALGDEPAT